MREQPNPIQDRRWFDAAFGRIAAFASGKSGKGTPASIPMSAYDELPEAEPLARLLLVLAVQWSNEARVLDFAALEDEVFDGPEALAAFANRHGIDVTSAPRKVASLRASDLPALMIAKSGLGRMLASRDGKTFLALGHEGPYPVDLSILSEEESGTLFLARATRKALETDKRESANSLKPNDLTIRNENPVQDIVHHLMAHQRPQVVQLMIAAAFSNIMLVALPVYTGLVFDRVIPHSAFDTLWAISLGVLIALLADLAVRWVRLKLQDAIAGTASAAIQAAAMRRLVEVKMMDAPRSAGAVTLRLREIDSLTQLVPQFLTGVAIDAPFLMLIFALIWLNGGAAVFAPVFGICALVAMHHIANLNTKTEQARAMGLMQVQTNHLIETVDGLETVKTTRTERRVLGRFEALFDDYAYSAHVTRLWSGISSYASVTVGQIMVVLVMMIGAYKVSMGEMTIGALSTCSLLVGRVISPIGQLVSVMHRMHQSRQTLKALSTSHAENSECERTANERMPAPRSATIRLANVNVMYRGQTRNQLDNVSLTIREGERVAIIGRSGSGKSTLLKLFTQLVEPTSGSVLVDERDSRQYDVSDLRRSLGYMGQTPGIVDDTLLTNLTLGLDHIDPVRLDAVMRLSGVSEFASTHPQGIAMMVGPRGEKLSGGERQSVALARLLLSNSKAMLLDEPTASMDTMLEMRLVQDLKAEIGSKTLIIATHRAPLLQLVDRLIWLDHGRVLADGPKEDVLKRLSTAA